MGLGLPPTVAEGSTLDPARFVLDGRAPRRVFAPADLGELAALLEACDGDGRAVVFFGGNTLQSLGFAPARYDVAISFEKLARILEYEPKNLTIAVQAGMTVGALEGTLAEHGQFVPLDVPRASLATVGGSLASGWLGPRRARYGGARDYVIGSTVVLADGTVAKAGGMVVKNSTGYDLSKLYIGSLGTLCAIARANFKTLPLAEKRRIAIAGVPEGARARAIDHVNALSIEPSAALVVRGFASEIEGADGTDERLILLYEGSESLVERATRDLRSALGAAGLPATRLIDREVGAVFANVLDAYVAERGHERSATYRSTGLATESSLRADEFGRFAREERLELETIEDLRTGDVIARLSSELRERFAERLIAFDAARAGSSLANARVLVAPAAMRGHLAAWGAVPSTHATLRALKTRFDPKATLAPGRYVAGI